MGFIRFNTNPVNNLVGDCTVRAVSVLTDQTWDDTYLWLVTEGFVIKDMPSSNEVWGSYLKHNGFKKTVIPDTCPNCYTVKDFCMDYPKGRFLLSTGSHVIAVVDGNYYDTWDSGDELPIYYWERR